MAATHSRKCFLGSAFILRIRDVVSTSSVSFKSVVVCTIDYIWSCLARTAFVFSHSSRPCICCMVQAILSEDRVPDSSALFPHEKC